MLFQQCGLRCDQLHKVPIGWHAHTRKHSQSGVLTANELSVPVAPAIDTAHVCMAKNCINAFRGLLLVHALRPSVRASEPGARGRRCAASWTQLLW